MHDDLLSLIVPLLSNKDLLSFISLGGPAPFFIDTLTYLLEKKYAKMYPLLYSIHQEYKLTDFVVLIKDLFLFVKIGYPEHPEFFIAMFIFALITKRGRSISFDKVESNFHILNIYFQKLSTLFENKAKNNDGIYGVYRFGELRIFDINFDIDMNIGYNLKFGKINNLLNLYQRMIGKSIQFTDEKSLIDDITQTLRKKHLIIILD